MCGDSVYSELERKGRITGQGQYPLVRGTEDVDKDPSHMTSSIALVEQNRLTNPTAHVTTCRGNI